MKKDYATICLERAEKATEGPWSDFDAGPWGGQGVGIKIGDNVREWALFGKTTTNQNILNASFCAHARTDVPELARRLKKAIHIIEMIQKAGAYDDAIHEMEAIPEGE